MQDVANLYSEALVWDDHGGFELQAGMPVRPSLEAWFNAGVDYLSINIGYDVYPAMDTVQAIAWVRGRIAQDAPFARLVGSVAEIDAARAEGLMAVTFDIEGMKALGGRIEMIELYYGLGVRHMNFAYNRNNEAGGGCHDEDVGLTDLGRAAIDEMNRVGMVVDCTHCSYRTSMEAIERSTAPVIFSHSNPKALHVHGRNITDDQIRASAATGGVIGINGVNLFLGVDKPTAADVARHAAYVTELTSVDHVGICLDDSPLHEDEKLGGMLAATPNYRTFWPASEGYGPDVECLNIRDLPNVAVELARIGFDDTELRKVLGLNFRRVAEQVWKPVAAAAAPRWEEG